MPVTVNWSTILMLQIKENSGSDSTTLKRISSDLSETSSVEQHCGANEPTKKPEKPAQQKAEDDYIPLPESTSMNELKSVPQNPENSSTVDAVSLEPVLKPASDVVSLVSETTSEPTSPVHDFASPELSMAPSTSPTKPPLVLQTPTKSAHPKLTSASSEPSDMDERPVSPPLSQSAEKVTTNRATPTHCS